jgi:hypothetical protein
MTYKKKTFKKRSKSVTRRSRSARKRAPRRSRSRVSVKKRSTSRKRRQVKFVKLPFSGDRKRLKTRPTIRRNQTLNNALFENAKVNLSKLKSPPPRTSFQTNQEKLAKLYKYPDPSNMDTGFDDFVNSVRDSQRERALAVHEKNVENSFQRAAKRTKVLIHNTAHVMENVSEYMAPVIAAAQNLPSIGGIAQPLGTFNNLMGNMSGYIERITDGLDKAHIHLGNLTSETQVVPYNPFEDDSRKHKKRN